MSNRFSWLHLSDLHTGMDAKSWMWPGIKAAIYEDLKYLISEHGPWDVVVFSGDLTQQGTCDEFQALTATLKEIWEVFKANGFQPKLFCVPGNHDLARPKKLDPTKMILSQWWETPELREAFWEKDGDEIRVQVSSYFSNYENWLASLPEAGIPVLQSRSGIMPGDVASVYDGGDIRVGLVGLNSAWLQVDGSNYKGRLDIDPHQLGALTDNDPTSWTARNTINLLVTHHPLDWLHPSSLKKFNQEIDVSGRFSAHLYGHMHTPQATQQGYLGMEVKRSIQSASLFGLHGFGEGEERKHGYSLHVINVQSSTDATLTIWPRAAREVGGERRLGADFTLPIDNQNKITHSFQLTNVIRQDVSASLHSAKLSDNLDIVTQVKDAELVADISGLAKIFPPSPESLRVRAVQLASAVDALQTNRCLWLAAEWGMGDKGFIWAVQQKMSSPKNEVFSMDLSGYHNRAQFFNDARSTLGFGFEAICDALSKLANPYMIFEDVPFGADEDHGLSLYRDIQNLTEVMLSYCPSLKIIILSRQKPPVNDSNIVEITALDQADTRNFVEAHSLGGDNAYGGDEYLKIFQHTDGLPYLIEADLRNLRVASVSEVTSVVAGATVPDGALSRAISEIAESKEPGLARAYLLLKILSVFPQGEELNRIKHFDRSKPVFFDHARILEQRGFIQGVEVNQFDRASQKDKPKRLVSTRPVREWMQSQLTQKEQARLGDYAAALYFGDSWASGEFKPPHHLKFNTAGRITAEVDNARSIVRRVISAAGNNARKLSVAIALVKFHGAALIGGDYFRSACEFFENVVPALGDDIAETDMMYITYLHAKAQRMLDGKDSSTKAKEMLLLVLPHTTDKSTLISIYMNLALCSKALSETENIITYAEKVIDLDKSGYSSLGAQQLIFEATLEGEEAALALAKLEVKARKRGANSTAVGIAISRAHALDNDVEKVVRFRSVVNEAQEAGDSYNIMRGMIALGGQTLIPGSGFKLESSEERLLIRIYHYLYNERFDAQFNKCHNILWKIFKGRNELHNLMQLFRYSSLMWRLRGQVSYEEQALRSLNDAVARNKALNLTVGDVSTSYFYARLGAVMQKADTLGIDPE